MSEPTIAPPKTPPSGNPPSQQTTPYAPVTKFIPSTMSSRPSPLKLIRTLLLDSQGREVAIRAVQYLLRLYIYISARPRPYHRSPPSMLASASRSPRSARLLFCVSVLSTFRKLLALIEHSSQIDALANPISLASPKPSSVRPFKDSAAESNIEDAELTNEGEEEDVMEEQALMKGELGPGPGFAERWKSLSFAKTFLSLIQSLADDVECFGRLGLLSEATRRLADRIADASWLVLSLADLVRVQSERGKCWAWGRRVRTLLVDTIEARASFAKQFYQARESQGSSPERQSSLSDSLYDTESRNKIRKYRTVLRLVRHQLYYLWWTRIKLLADVLFATYDTFDLTPAGEGVRAFSGALSAVIWFKEVWREIEQAHVTKS